MTWTKKGDRFEGSVSGITLFTIQEDGDRSYPAILTTNLPNMRSCRAVSVKSAAELANLMLKLYSDRLYERVAVERRAA